MKIYQSCAVQASRLQRLRARLAALLCVCIACFGPVAARAQVPFVPTPPDVVQRMLSLAGVTKDDYLIDLGSGDGRVVRAAARLGARGFGVEHDPELVARSNELARRDGVADRVSFMAQDLFETDISDATVVTMYLLPAVNLKLRPRLLAQLKPGTRVVSHDFDMGEWAPDASAKLYSKEKFSGTGGESTVFLWIVPADFSGRWTWRLELAGQAYDYELSASQRFQKLEAVLRVGGATRPVQDLRVDGDRIRFTFLAEVKGSSVRQSFDGRASGDAIVGQVDLSGPRLMGAADWAATRRERGARVASAQAVSAQTAVAALAQTDIVEAR